MPLKRISRIVVTAVALLVATLLPAAPAGAAAEVYGGGIDLVEVTPIADILADPDAYVGKTVRVEGGVLDVCPMKGCWIRLGDDHESIRVKVDDDVIVFPASAKGRIAAAQGRVEAVEMTREGYIDWLAHLAEERGETFDVDAADIGDGPFRILRIQGTGARIETPEPSSAGE